MATQIENQSAQLTDTSISKESTSKPIDQNTRQSKETASGTFVYAMTLLIGTFFGIVLTKSEVVRWQRIHDMFLFREAHMYLIIGVGVLVAMIAMFLIRKFSARDIYGKPISYKPKPFHKGVIIGGMIFGAGWAITGACPGPIYAQVGSGAWISLFTLAGALAGMYGYAFLQTKLPH